MTVTKNELINYRIERAKDTYEVLRFLQKEKNGIRPLTVYITLHIML